MSLKIYTRTGDKGQTSLFGGKRVPKYSLRVETYGTVDELNSAIGIAIAEMSNSSSSEAQAESRSKKILKRVQDDSSRQARTIKKELENIQHDLFDIGSALATPGIGNNPSTSLRAGELGIRHLSKRVDDFENLIDELTAKLPELRNFILPGGSVVGAHLHLARTICRRAERRIVELSQKEPIDPYIIKYVNRLSDLLFTIARFVNQKEKQKELIWRSH